jgi:O-antigen/teichoic acid export membrane protein
LLIARGLGPADYGILSFLLASFTAFRSLLDIGSSSAFYSFISKKLQSKKFINTYLIWLLIQFIILILFIVIIAPDNWIINIWQGEFRERVLLAFVAVFFQQQIWGVLSQIGESQRLTVRIQSINLSLAVVHLLIIYGLYFFDALSIERIFILIIIEFLLVGIISLLIIDITYSEEILTLREIIQQHIKYCLPIIPLTYLGLVMNFADTWLLQRYGGAIEQAYYGIGYRFAAISLIATQSVLKIFWKEVAEANEKGNEAKISRIYNLTNRVFFIFGCVISGFLIPWASEIIQLFLGEEYIGGALVLSLMFLYPIHQSLGQIIGTMYLALELTKKYAILGIIHLSLSIIAVYFLLAPGSADIPGLGLASTGLAIKMLIIQVVSVNLSVWWLCRYKGWKFSIIYQIVGISSFIFAGFFSKHMVSFLLGNDLQQLVQFMLTGLLYIITSGLFIYSMPWLLNMDRNEIKKYVLQAKTLI